MIGHNIRKHDIHHICLPLEECEPETKLDVILSTDENFMSFSAGVFIKNFQPEAGQQVPIFENIRLVDSFNFFPQTLESLVADLPDNCLDIFRSKYESYSNSDFQLLCQKILYCYSYIPSDHVFGEKVLPPLPELKNTLLGGELTVSETEYNRTQTMFSKFGCQNIGDCHDLHLTCDTLHLLLSCFVETLRCICYDTYGLDCAQYYGA